MITLPEFCVFLFLLTAVVEALTYDAFRKNEFQAGLILLYSVHLATTFIWMFLVGVEILSRFQLSAMMGAYRFILGIIIGTTVLVSLTSACMINEPTTLERS